MQNLLSFLSGDKWEIEFRERKSKIVATLGLNKDIANVCLLSGGLDSFIGAIDLMSNGDNISFVRIIKRGRWEKNISKHL